MIRSLISWTQLTRNGTPDFIVTRRPMLVHGVTVAVGDPVPGEIVANRVRLRQLYEQRMIEPAVAPVGSVQAQRKVKAQASASTASPASKVPVAGTPKKSSALSFDTPSVPVQEVTSGSGGYQPARKQIAVR